MEKIFVIGDVHGCFNTLQKLLEHWNQETEQLIFVGDLIDRGNFSPETVQLVKNLVRHNDAVCLMGNHEFAMANALLTTKEETWFGTMGAEVLAQYEKKGLKPRKDAKWMQDLPLIWQSEHFMISHAGFAKEALFPLIKTDRDSVLWTRKPLKNLESKIQIHGHTPSLKNPKYTPESNSWNIDSAAVYSHKLTGIKFNTNGTHIETIQVDTLKIDVPKKYELSE